MSPVDFEVYCAEVLTNCGWTTTLTPLDRRPGRRCHRDQKWRPDFGRQCKTYSSSVGNSALQEIAAGIDYIDVQHGIVVTNNTYTRAAKQPAAVNGFFAALCQSAYNRRHHVS